NRSSQDPVDTIKTVASLDELNTLRESVDHVKIEPSISEYLLQIVMATRNHPHVRLGVSTRGTLLYARIARALAILEGRDYVIPEDIKKLAIPVMSHRMILNTKAQYSGLSSSHIIQEILERERVPR
ncbi:MAG TPA: MoxR family ATPase, partial [Candidatus Omnitrophota bacterium]|nr:MoxR family ATPase [Candidatus Omnitrophota bacterium]